MIATAPPARAYDRAAFHASIRQSDVFLCTYPKSGTTWLGFLLAQVLKPDEAEPLDLKSFGKYVPDVNLLYTKRGSLARYADLADPRFFLCHATHDAKLAKVVYVVRDPRDTMVSYWHYRKFLSPDFNQSLGEYLAGTDHWPCDWDAHVAGWLLPRRHPGLLLVKYEDLHRDAAAVLRGVLEFAGVEVSADRIAAAVEASGFDRMRAAEDRGGVHGKAGDPNERFVRKGRVGGWRDELGNAELRILERKYGDVMRRIGYEPET